jgi:hypothetical protein
MTPNKAVITAAGRVGAGLSPAVRASGRMAARRAQRGLSLIGLLFVAGVVIALAIVAMRVVPSVLEYMAIKSAVVKVADTGAPSARELQLAFERFAAVDDIKSITGKDLIIEKVDGSTVISFDYEKRIELFGPVSLVINYQGSSRR